MKAIMRRAAHLMLGAVLVVALCLVVVIALGPRTGAYRTMTVLSASMRPTYGPGSVVLVRPTAVTELEVGDVITYKIPVDDRRVVTHRIVEIVEAGGRPVVRTQGDANNAADPWLARLEGGVAWRAEASVPWLGYGIGALREPLLSRGLVLLCPLLLCLLLVADVWRRPDAEADQALVYQARHALVHQARHMSARAGWASGRRWTRGQASRA